MMLFRFRGTRQKKLNWINVINSNPMSLLDINERRKAMIYIYSSASQKDTNFSEMLIIGYSLSGGSVFRFNVDVALNDTLANNHSMSIVRSNRWSYFV